MNIAAILSVTTILFSVIDMFGNLPIIIDMKKKDIHIKPTVATVTAGALMIGFLLFGTAILSLFGIDVGSFALAGSLIILFIALEMILGIRLFRDQHEQGGHGSIVPVAFPLLAGAGTLTTILSLKAEFDVYTIMGGIFINLVIIFLILRSSDWLSKNTPPQVIGTLRKVFGIILLAIAIQMAKENIM